MTPSQGNASLPLASSLSHPPPLPGFSLSVCMIQGARAAGLPPPVPPPMGTGVRARCCCHQPARWRSWTRCEPAEHGAPRTRQLPNLSSRMRRNCPRGARRIAPPFKGPFLPVPPCLREPGTEPRGPRLPDALPSGGAECAAADSWVTAAMPGMWLPPPKWRPAARAGSITGGVTGSVASDPAREGRKRHLGLGWEEPGSPECHRCPILGPPVLSRHLGMAARQPPTSRPSRLLLVPACASAVSPHRSRPRRDTGMGTVWPRCPGGRRRPCPWAALSCGPTAPKGKLDGCGMQGRSSPAGSRSPHHAHPDARASHCPSS